MRLTFYAPRQLAFAFGLLAFFFFILHLIFEPFNAGPLLQLMSSGSETSFDIHHQSIFLISFRVCRLIFAFFLFYYLRQDDALKEASCLYLLRQILAVASMAFSIHAQSSLFYLILLGIVNVLGMLAIIFFIFGFIRHRLSPVFPWTSFACLILLIIGTFATLFMGPDIITYIDIISKASSFLFLIVLLSFILLNDESKKIKISAN